MLLLCVLKIKNIGSYLQFNTPAVKVLFLLAIIIVFSSFNLKDTSTQHSLTFEKKHPFYISVVDIKHDAKTHNLNISVKLFTNDIESALKKTSRPGVTKTIDLLNPKNKPEMEQELMNYIQKRLFIEVNLKPTKLNFIGYEKEEDAIWIYLEIKKVNQPKKLKINTKLLYDFLPLETNIVHVDINGVKKSSKVTNPDSKVEFNF